MLSLVANDGEKMLSWRNDYIIRGYGDVQCCLFYKILVTDTGTSGRRQYHCSACKSFPAEAVGTLSALLVHLQAENFLQHFALVVAVGAYIALFTSSITISRASSRCSLVHAQPRILAFTSLRTTSGYWL